MMGEPNDKPIAELLDEVEARAKEPAADSWERRTLPRLVRELRERIEREQNRDAKHIEECDCCGDPYCAECTNADHDNYCSRNCEGRSETEDSVASNP